jgi:hypothetical protein
MLVARLWIVMSMLPKTCIDGDDNRVEDLHLFVQANERELRSRSRPKVVLVRSRSLVQKQVTNSPRSSRTAGVEKKVHHAKIVTVAVAFRM